MEIRSIAAEEIGSFRKTINETFGGDLDPADTLADERFRALIQRGRAWAAFDRGGMVATAAAFALDLAVPGGRTPMAGLTMVTVRPSHRRRGLLRGLIDAYLVDARERNEPLGGLWASEATIYGRFGFGLAAEGEYLSMAATAIDVPAELGGDDLEMIDGELLGRMLPSIYEKAATRPGMYARNTSWWMHRRLMDRPDLRKGASQRRHLVARRGEHLTGYVAYRQRAGWENGLATGTVEIDELIALDPRAEASLWRFLANVDLFPRVAWSNLPIDSILPWIVDDWRQVQRRRTDTLWIRIDDLPVVMAARRYQEDGALRFAVTPPGGGEPLTWLLEVSGNVGRCTRTDGAADLRLSLGTLGSIYLGGIAPTLLGRAGKIAGERPALLLADKIFRWPLAPWCPEMF